MLLEVKQDIGSTSGPIKGMLEHWIRQGIVRKLDSMINIQLHCVKQSKGLNLAKISGQFR